jgi:hypothetical protein
VSSWCSFRRGKLRAVTDVREFPRLGAAQDLQASGAAVGATASDFAWAPMKREA